MCDSVTYCRWCELEQAPPGSEFCSAQCQEEFEQMTGLTAKEYDVVEEERVHERREPREDYNAMH